MTMISGWGRYPIVETELLRPYTRQEARIMTSHLRGGIARGNGRAYGDAGIGVLQTIQIGALNRICSFDAKTGLLRAEAGLLLADAIAAFLPRGFFPVVVPGTKYVTIGGAIAADVHGKNHHRDGGFGDHVEDLVLALPDGNLVSASRTQNSDIFGATIGGMGLTGTILEATFRLRPVETGWIHQRTIVAPDLATTIAALEEGDRTTYSAAWIDCLAKGANLGRSLVYLGKHAVRADLRGEAAAKPFPPIGDVVFSVPFDFPAIALNAWIAGTFNSFYLHHGARRAGAQFLVPADSYFFPLDSIGSWNRLYGRRGFVQHQSVVPTAAAPAILGEMLDRIAVRRKTPFLSVLKKLGPGSGTLSFPSPGYTLSLDFILSPSILEFLDELDSVVVAAGGRLYLAKDARQSRATFEGGYLGLKRFRETRHLVDPTRRLESYLSRRLGI